jgi:hypothetical protein
VSCATKPATPSVYFYFSLDSAKLHYPATNKKKRREYLVRSICHEAKINASRRGRYLYLVKVEKEYGQ